MTSRTWTAVARYLLGGSFMLFGLNGFLHFLPTPPGMPQPAVDFGLALATTGYMFPLIKGTEVVAAALLLSNRFVPLALTVLAPVVVNILAFHAFLAPSGMLIPLVILALGLFLAYQYREAFAPVLRARHEPAQAVSAAGRGEARPATA